MRGVEEGRPVMPGYLSEHEGVCADDCTKAARSLRRSISSCRLVVVSFGGQLTASFGRVMLGVEEEGFVTTLSTVKRMLRY